MSKSAMQKALDALEREQVIAQDNNGDYTINVTPKHITEAIVELRAALAELEAVEPVAYIDAKGDYYDYPSHGKQPTRPLYLHPAPAKPPSARDVELIDGMIDVQLDHAKRCDSIPNKYMAEKQKGWDMERVELLRRIKAAHGIKETS